MVPADPCLIGHEHPAARSQNGGDSSDDGEGTPGGTRITDPAQRPASISCWFNDPPGGGQFPYPFLFPEFLFACNPFLLEARNPVHWGFPSDFAVECATWENGGLSWVYHQDEDEAITYWAARVKQPCFRFCSIPKPYPEKGATDLSPAPTATSAAPWEQYPASATTPSP
ncbi:MAG: hypothetical protein OXF22_08450 [Anaerolineaceae bacterium]|nr:hypothetical protein [Anaerolineaceae bacterium]